MNPRTLHFTAFPLVFFKKFLLSIVLIFTIQSIWSQTLVGSMYLFPNTEGVYSLSIANQVGVWEVRHDGILTETHYNANAVRVRAKDTCNSFISFKVTLSSGKILRKTVVVRDNVRPVFDSGFDTVSLPLNNLDGRKPSATDNSGKPVTVRLKDYGAMYGMCMMTLTWEARDVCGNTTLLKQTVFPTTQDTVPPKFEIEQCITYACDSVPNPFPSPKVMDNSNLVQITLVNQSYANGFIGFCKTYGLYLTWEALDACGNLTREIQTVLVKDKVAPKFNTDTVLRFAVCSPNDIPGYRPHVKDNCSDPVIVNRVSRRFEPFPCGFKVWDTWEAIDACENRSTAVQEIIIKDSIGPQFMVLPNICTPCAMIPHTFPTPMVVDNCDPAPVVTLFKTLGLPMGCTGMPYDLILVWKAVDRCGNETIAYQTVNVRAVCGGMPPVGGGDLVRQNSVPTQAVVLRTPDKNVGETNDLDMAFNLPVLKDKNGVQLLAFPNPTNGTVHFNIQSPLVGEAILSLFDATGRQIGIVKQAYLEAEKDILMQFDIPNAVANGLIFYKLTLGSVTIAGKVNYIK